MSSEPTKFTPERREVIIAALLKGATMKDAAHFARIGRTTLYEWLQRGEQGIEPYVQFAVDVRQAQSQSALDMLEVIEKAAKQGGDVKAAMWLLERRHGYVPDQRVQLTGQDGGPVQVAQSVISPEQAAAMTDEQLDRALAELRGDG